MHVIDNAYSRRFLVALGLSAFIHGLIIGAGPLHPLRVREEQRASTPVAIELRTPPPLPAPLPTPVRTPLPKPTVVVQRPRPVVRHRPAPALATAPPAEEPGGSASAKELATTAPAAPPNGTTGAGIGVAAGGSGSGAGPGSGSGGANGTENGSGGASQPCGSVSLVPAAAPTISRSGMWLETIRVMMTFRDGHSESGVFPYPFVYRNEAADPWSPPNLSKDIAVPVPLPPPGTDLSNADRVVLETLRYTRGDGRTVLPPCSGSP